MANELEHRVGRLEKSVEEYVGILYRWLDELRTDMKQLRHEHEERMHQNEERMRQNEEALLEYRERTDKRFQQNEDLLHSIAVMNGHVLQLIDAMDNKIDGLEKRIDNSP